MGATGGWMHEPGSLVGTWRLSRTIEDRLLGQHSNVDGTLQLTAVSADRISWQEQGRWRQATRAGGPATSAIEVHRSLWIVRDRPEAPWWVRFEDERDFHPWTPGVDVVHPCGEDTYRGVVRGTPDNGPLTGPEQWSVQWDVTGPGKDYLMSTELSRISAGAVRRPRAR